MYYLPYSKNPDRSHLVPGEYPWQVSNTKHSSEWIFVDNIEEFQNSFDLSAYSKWMNDQAYQEEQRLFREFGEPLAKEAVDRVGGKNLELEALGTPVDTTALLQQLSSVKALLETGSLKTARNLVVYLKPSFAFYEEVFQYVADSITAFLQGGGYESQSDGGQT